MTFRIEATLADAGSAKRVLQRKMGEVTKRKLNDTGYDMVKTANQKMAANFDLNRPGNRRRHEGSRRTRGALDFQIVGNELPMALRYRILGGDVVRQRIIMLNWGTVGHEIVPSGTAGGSGVILAWPEDGVLVKTKRVWHPGSRKGVGFLEDAMSEAIQRTLLR